MNNKFNKILAIVLCLVMAVGSVAAVVEPGGGGEAPTAGETVTVTVNFVYDSNKAMVSQPFSAQIAKGAEFKRSVAAPKILNYSVPADRIEGTGTGISYAEDTDGNGAVNFDIASLQSDITVTLYYVAGQANYKVQYWQQNLQNDEYTLFETVDVTGDIDAYTSAAQKEYPGFYCTGVPENIIAADGTTVVDIYYNRSYCTVTFDVNGGIGGPAPMYVKAGTTFDSGAITAPTKAGYYFAGWDPEINTTVTENAVYTAKWTLISDTADYTIVLWGQNANDDEYSYLSSHEAWGSVGETVTWKEDALICDSHVHTDACYQLNCQIPEHDHAKEGCTLECQHVHDITCYGLSANAAAVDPNNGYGDNDARTHFEDSCSTCANNGRHLTNLADGTVCMYRNGKGSIYWNDYFYFLYFGGKYYEISRDQYDKLKSEDGQSIDHGFDTYSIYTANINCQHKHDASCYSCGQEEHTHSEIGGACYTLICGKTEHTHSGACYMGSLYPDRNKWLYERCEEVVVNADGSTVLNVYFKRVEYTLTFNYNYSGGWNGSYNKTESITARWGADISARYVTIADNAGSTFWTKDYDGDGPFTNYFGVMPVGNATYYNRSRSADPGTMTYYAEDLNGTYQEIFRVDNVGGYTVTEEDRYEFEGFTFDHGTANGDECDGAKFYYARNSYALNFYSADSGIPDRSESVKFQQNLGSYAYVPTNKPTTVEADAVFAGWYQNPQCTGDEFTLSAHNMPAANIALYAKWVNRSYTVTTYTDDTMGELYTYEGYTGSQTVEKYKTGAEPVDPVKEGEMFVGWFYKDAEGKEQLFSFTMPITQDYALYPKFSDQVMITYTVHYYLEGTTDKLADDRTNTVKYGTSVTEKAKMGTELNLVTTPNDYFPEKTSTAVQINQLDQEIIFYYKQGVTVPYTVKYQDKDGKTLAPDKVVSDNKFSIVTETYIPIDNYNPLQFQITKELVYGNDEENVIIFIYEPSNTSMTIKKSGNQDVNQVFLFKVEGVAGTETAGISLTVTIHGNGETTISNLPIGEYTVTEVNDWSWRYADQSAQTKTLVVDPAQNIVEFQNSRENGKWLSGDNYAVNIAGSADVQRGQGGPIPAPGN